MTSRALFGVILLAAACSVVAFAQSGSAPVPAPGNVALPLDEYNRLVDLAAKGPKKVDAPPSPYVLKSAAMKFAAASDAVSGTIAMEGEVFAKGDTAVPLVTDMTVFDAQRQGATLPIDQSGRSTRAVLPGPGEFSVSLRAGVPLRTEAGRAAITLPVPSAGAVQLTLVVPGDRTSVYLNPGIITSRDSSGGKTTIEATLTPGSNASIWWAAREVVAPAAPKEVRFLSDVKTLASVSESALTLVALVDITVVQGDPARFEIDLPAGYGVTGVTGPSLDVSDADKGVLTLHVRNAAQRSHQFLISMEKAIDGAKADVPFVTVKGSQRETGEAVVEGTGSLKLGAKESGSLKRMDLKESNPLLLSLAHDSPTAAFRYHRQTGEVPGLALEWVRFPESALPTAIAQSASVTTVVTQEGRSLTEVKLVVKNQSQPFLKVGLPAGATILSADVEGEKVKPAEGPDGQRVPLLRPGFRPTSAYTVSFVFLHAGTAFAKKGGSELSLPKMDMPVGLLQWEVFLPSRYKVADFGGNVTPQSLVGTWDAAAGEERGPVVKRDALLYQPRAGLVNSAQLAPRPSAGPALAAGQIGGVVTDPSGAAIMGARVTVTDVATGFTRSATADDNGRWVVGGFQSGQIRVRVDAAGFKSYVQTLTNNSATPTRVDAALQVGATMETVEVSTADTQVAFNPGFWNRRTSSSAPPAAARAAPPSATPVVPSSNILDMKEKVAGVLPIAIDIPKSGTSYRFVKPLVIDEETTVSFAYRTK